MIIVEKNQGTKIPYGIEENKITFDDEITINLAAYERDDANSIDVCRDKYGNLVTGVIPGLAENYVAQIDIPAREYDYIADGVDESGNPREVPMPKPFNMDKCALALWALAETEE
jgi:hypothetical protein